MCRARCGGRGDAIEHTGFTNLPLQSWCVRRELSVPARVWWDVAAVPFESVEANEQQSLLVALHPLRWLRRAATNWDILSSMAGVVGPHGVVHAGWPPAVLLASQPKQLTASDSYLPSED